MGRVRLCFDSKEGSSGDFVYVVFEREIIFKDDSKVVTVGGLRQGGGVNSEVETVNVFLKWICCIQDSMSVRQLERVA